MGLRLFIAALFISSLVGCLASTPRNVARGKTVDQSSTYTNSSVGSLTPDHAVDGDLSSDTSKLANTNNETGSNWWSVDLGQQYKIGKVIIFGRTAQNRKEYKIYILTTNKNSPNPPSPNDTSWEIVYYIEPKLSSRVEITLYLTDPYRHLALYREVGNIITREVEVYNWTGADDPHTLTLSQTANQSSNFSIAYASLAVDGKTDMRGAWGTYSGTVSAQTHWWRVSLKEPCTNCYVRLYPYLRPKKFAVGGYSHLLLITVLSSTLDSPAAPTPPSPSSSQWNTCYGFTEPQNGPIVGRCNGQNIKHVAVFKNTNQSLELVEVEVFHSVEDAFNYTSLTAESPLCVKMTWSVKPSHFISYFKFNCTGKAAQNISATVKEYTQCEYSPYEEVTSKIEAIGFGSKAVEKTTHTLCEAPAKPTDIIVTQEDQTSTELPKNRVKFTIRWTESEPNCAGVEYNVTLVGASSETTSDSPNRQAIFENRIAGAEYTITVTAINKLDNLISESDPHTFTANSTAPEFGNRGTAVTATSSDCVKLDWETPEYENGAVTKYRYKCSSRVWTEVESNVKSSDLVCGFDPYKNVTCEVQAKNNADRWSSSISNSATTLCAAPTKPTDIVVQQEDQTYSAGLPKNRIKFTISWNESEPTCAGVEYSVTLEGAPSETNSDSPNRQAIFENRIAGAEYTVTVTAKNKPDHQISVSDPHTFTANSRAPEFGNSRGTVTATSSDCVELDWKTPEYQNGAVTKYKYICDVWNGTRENIINAPATTDTVCGLKSASRVSCNITARNSGGVSPAVDIGSVFTRFKFIVEPAELKISENKVEGQINIVVALPTFENQDAELLYYQFIVEKVKNSPNSRRKRSSSTTSAVQLEQLFNYTTAEWLNLSYYVAGQLSPPADSNTIKFDYGTGEISDGFYNRKLNTGVLYKTHYLFTVKLGNEEIRQLILGNKASGVYVEPPSPPNSLAAIVAPIVVVAVLAIVLIPLALFYIKRRRASRKNDESSSMVTFENGAENAATSGAVSNSQPDTKPAFKNPLLAPNAQPIKKPALAVKPTTLSLKTEPENSESANPGGDVYMIAMPRRKIAAADRRSIQEYINNRKKSIVFQYKQIDSLPKIEMSRASDPDTKGKNRYKKLYPGDSHRVKLINNPNGCDYINASYLDGYNQPDKFIAAMGPLPNTVDDFWLMIWEQNVKTVVMVTRLIEECKDKCAQYWPEVRQETTYGEITVKLVAEDAWADYQVRNLHVRKGAEIRHVVQYHYLSWPDHGVPKYTGPFVSFYRKISKDVNDRIKKGETNPSPCVVHCSAGVGRTGTFIALDYLLDQAKEERELRVFECVKAMRERRPAMVQKEEQYFFIHAALLEAISSADVSTDPTTMKEKIVEFEQNRRGKLLEEFKITCEESEKIIHDFSSGEGPDNQSFNLTQDILPDGHFRPFLLDSNTGYINAVLINGTHVENQYICTQSPIPTTLNHFWAVIFDQGFATVIITQPNQLNILPSDEFKAGKYTIKKKKVWMDEFPTTEVQIHYKQKPMLKVTMFDMSEIWSDDKFIKCRYVITLYETVKRWLQQSKNPKVTVVCRDGATRCGLIINAFNCLEKLELEQQCDVYSSVLMSKIRRSELISTVDEYLYIYQVLREYADGYNAYANFD